MKYEKKKVKNTLLNIEGISLYKRKDYPLSQWRKYFKSSKKSKSPLFFYNKAKIKGKSHPRYKKGKTISGGYVLVLVSDHPFSHKNGYILEHRLVIEQYLVKNEPDSEFLIEYEGKKYLNPVCVIHYKNGVKSDNRVENLKVFKTGGTHTSFEFKNKYLKNRRFLKAIYKF